MTRTKQIIQAVMRVLQKYDGDPAEEAQIHFKASLVVHPKPSMLEISNALESCQEHGWASYFVTELESKQWAITGKGRLAEVR